VFEANKNENMRNPSIQMKNFKAYLRATKSKDVETLGAISAYQLIEAKEVSL